MGAFCEVFGVMIGARGIMALLALATASVKDDRRWTGALLAIGVFGAALFYGDAVLTPAISVLSAVEGEDAGTVLESFFLEYYGSAPSVPPQIVVPRESGDTAALAGFLSERRGARVEVRAAERGEKRRLQELATENARQN